MTVSRIALALLAALALAAQGPAAGAGATRKLYVDNTAGNSVTVIDLGTRRASGEIVVGEHPHGLGAAPDGRRIYVSVESTNSVAVIDTRVDRVLSSIPTTGRPNQLAVTPDGRFVYVAIADVSDRCVCQFDPGSDHRLAQTVRFDGDVRPLCVTRDEKRLFVALYGLHGFAWADLESSRVM